MRSSRNNQGTIVYRALTRRLYEAHYRSMSWDVHVAPTSLRTGVDKHHNFTHIDWQPNHAATADIAQVLGRALQ